MAAVILFACHIISSWINRYFINTPAQHILKQQAEQFYQSEQFEKAYRLFAALDETGYSAAYCLEHQVLCLSHLGHAQLAIRHCRFALRRKAMAKWYLLLIDLYIKQNDWKSAMDAACAGIDTLPATDHELHELFWKRRWLRSQNLADANAAAPVAANTAATLHNLNLLSRNVSSPPDHDILAALPCELVTTIFQHLSLADIALCSAVSRNWHQFIRSTPVLWQHLGVNRHHPRLTAITIGHYLARLQGAPLLSLCIHSDLNGDDLLYLLTRTNCSQLHRLELLGPYYTSARCLTSRLDQIMSMSSSSLRTLKLGSSSFKLNEIFNTLSRHCPQLESLAVHDCFTSLGSTVANSSLHHLDPGATQRLEIFGQFVAQPFIDFVHQFTPLVHLKTLRLTRIHGLTILPLAMILLSTPNLERLKMEASLVNLIPVINILIRACPQLHDLHYQRNHFSSSPVNSDSPHPQPTSTWHAANINVLPQNVPPTTTLNPPPWLPTLPTSRRIRKANAYTNIVCQHWRQLELKETRVLNDDLLHYLLRDSYAKLTSFDVQGHTKLTDQALLRSLPHGPLISLQHCVLAQCIHLTEHGLCAFFAQCPKLKTLDVSGLSGVTNRVLHVLAVHCPNLTDVNLSQCRSISATGLRSFIATLLHSKTAAGMPLYLDKLQLARTDIPMDCIAEIMALTRRDGI
ncbi:hypothetical protein BC940DRAFT_289563 [Gongronella butleri]|nr:hypothetical protein BC940DRAFT_289563 [Gongronella butleri]